MSTSESSSVVGCWKTSILTIPDYASSVYTDKDIVCKATNDVEFDLQWIHVDPGKHTLSLPGLIHALMQFFSVHI